MAVPKEQYVVDSTGRKKAVVLSLNRYEQLISDLHDLAVVAERREETSISLEEVKQRLVRDGLL
ncbi:MAG: type II toxin-antitoxin system Phd/YefM family antitoxin [Armatimonadetes bacterium]|nr:type II toxin-antitoxin system Phd/YefM family antitoxin [Armatimonadota bacterium]